jgi:hypothetical protein
MVVVDRAEVLKVTIITSYLKLMEYVLYTYALFQSRNKKKQNVKESRSTQSELSWVCLPLEMNRTFSLVFGPRFRSV